MEYWVGKLPITPVLQHSNLFPHRYSPSYRLLIKPLASISLMMLSSTKSLASAPRALGSVAAMNSSEVSTALAWRRAWGCNILPLEDCMIIQDTSNLFPG